MGEPDPFSLCGRIRSFFERNPDEMLTRADMCIKFNASWRQIEYAVLELRRHGALKQETGWIGKGHVAMYRKP